MDLAKSLERACFDYLIIEDSSYVPDAYGGNSKAYLASATASPKLDPVVLAPVLADHTSRIGIVPTLSVNVGVGLAVASLLVLIYFIHHVSQALQAEHLIAQVGSELGVGCGRGARATTRSPPSFGCTCAPRRARWEPKSAI